MPWHLPSDLKNFKKVTMGKPIIMGRRTYELLGRALPGRSNIVVSRENGISDPDVFVAPDKPAAMKIAEHEANRLGVNEIIVIGGEAVFALFEAEVQRVYMTEIDAEVPGDAFFRSTFNEWSVTNVRRVEQGAEGDQYSFTISQLDRRSGVRLKKERNDTRCLAVA